MAIPFYTHHASSISTHSMSILCLNVFLTVNKAMQCIPFAHLFLLSSSKLSGISLKCTMNKAVDTLIGQTGLLVRLAGRLVAVLTRALIKHATKGSNRY